MTKIAQAFLALALAASPAAAAAAASDVKAGVDAYERGDFREAVTIWRPLAIAGDADAQYNLGQAYRLGRGIPADPKLAEIWYRRAADQGHLKARDAYGLQLFQNGDRAAAMPFLEESAGRGEPRAQYVYATALFNGDIVKKDWVRAYALMSRASASGISAASSSLAQMDKFIPIDQRQRGLALAGAMASAGARGSNATGSVVGDAPSRPAVVAVAPPRAAPAKAPIAARPAPAAKPATAVTAPASGPWRVQLGAFANAAAANTLWNGLRARIPALQPYRSFVVPAARVTRLQAGPLPSRSAANELCARVKSGGQGCFPVGP